MGTEQTPVIVADNTADYGETDIKTLAQVLENTEQE